MRQDQYEKLQALAEKLTDVFLIEADPVNWPGNGIAPNAMDKATRGDRVWVKKDAAGTAVLIMKAIGMVGMIQRASTGGGAGVVPEPGVGDAPETEGEEIDGMEGQIAAYEKEAEAVLAKVQKRLDKRE